MSAWKQPLDLYFNVDFIIVSDWKKQIHTHVPFSSVSLNVGNSSPEKTLV